jgi:hypothetical protein
MRGPRRRRSVGVVPASTPPDPRFLRRWIGAVTAAETVGFLLPASAFAVRALAGLPPWPGYALVVAAGVGEGAVLGGGQALALRRSGVGVRAGAWVPATAAAAGVAWSVGMLPATLPPIDTSSRAALAAVAAGGLVLLLSIPTAQWPLLRPHVPRASRWIPLNVLAWGVGILWTFAPSPVITEDTPAGALAATYAVAGLLMAVTVATGTGLGLRRMLTVAPAPPNA